MKKLTKYSTIAACFGALLLGGCSKDIYDRTANIPALMPQVADGDAGEWKPYLLASNEEFPVAAPIAVTNPDYIAQVNEIKAAQADYTSDEAALVKYWSAGAVLRWNEIMRELVSKRNLPPYQNDDGTYPAPSSTNPLAYPIFPFANPPYAARAYAYVAAAQYDALIAAYHYKAIYNRKAPYKADSTLNVKIPKNDLPSYPSEDAVVAGAAVELLKLLFPADQDYINQRAQEHMQARILSGANVRSDLEAGQALGKAVAQKFATRARGDRAGTAGGNQASWAALENDCLARGEVPWYSFEVPKRPPMLPGFGKVRSFLIDSLGVIALRPGPPPAVESEKMKQETLDVYNYIKNPSRERIRIVHFWADGAGTYTPPGHWDAIAADEFIKQDLSEVRWARNMALLNMTLFDAAIVCWDVKYFYYNPRPTQLNPAIKTLTGIPNFPSYISGHSTFSGAAAAVLGHLLPAKAQVFADMAQEASMSRVYGGIHYLADCQTGLEVGKKVGGYAIERAKTDGAE